jgi:hypothetical protein
LRKSFGWAAWTTPQSHGEVGYNRRQSSGFMKESRVSLRASL